MKLVRRALLILLGYAFAALIGSSSYLLIGGLSGGLADGWWQPQDFAATAAVIAFSVGIIAIPVTLPLIILLEHDWKYRLAACLAGGLFLGVLMAGLLGGGGFPMPARLAAIVATFGGAASYWAFAFRVFGSARLKSDPARTLEGHIA